MNIGIRYGLQYRAPRVNAHQIIDQVQEVVSRWSDFVNIAGVFDSLANEIKLNQRIDI
jgi:hypothetical protein